MKEMTQEEINEIYDRLLELTSKDAIRWKGRQHLLYGSDFSVTLSRSSIELDRKDASTVLRIYNDEGLLVAQAVPADYQESISYGVKDFVLDASELYDLVEGKVYKYAETSKNILDELPKKRKGRAARKSFWSLRFTSVVSVQHSVSSTSASPSDRFLGPGGFARRMRAAPGRCHPLASDRAR